MHKAIITSVWRGIESTSEIESEDSLLFYARVAGSVQGICASGAHVTDISFEKVDA